MSKKITVGKVRSNHTQSFKDVIKALNIDEFYTKSDMKQKKYNKIILGVVPEENFNYMSDLVEMPTTSKGYKWLLVVLDLATNKFDIEQMKNKTSLSTLNAFKEIIKRKILILPEISLKTDGGTEFKAEFNQYLRDHNIFHKVAMPYRKQQMGPVEGLNGVITRILMNYLNDKTIELNKDYNDWIDKIPAVRTEVNNYRSRDLTTLTKYQDQFHFDLDVAGEQDYNVGDFVHWKINRPTDIKGNPINDGKFRNGDRRYSLESREIVDVLCYPTEPYYRYKLNEMNNVSFSKYDLKKSTKENNTFIVKNIIGKKTLNKIKYYLVHWKGKLKSESSWEPALTLIEDDLQDYITEFEKKYRKKHK